MAAQYTNQDLNFFAFRASFSAFVSPPSNFSAPTFLPLLGHPYFGLKTLFHKLQDDSRNIRVQASISKRKVFIKVLYINENTYK